MDFESADVLSFCCLNHTTEKKISKTNKNYNLIRFSNKKERDNCGKNPALGRRLQRLAQRWPQHPVIWRRFFALTEKAAFPLKMQLLIHIAAPVIAHSQ